MTAKLLQMPNPAAQAFMDEYRHKVSCGVETFVEDRRGCGVPAQAIYALQPKLSGPAGNNLSLWARAHLALCGRK